MDKQAKKTKRTKPRHKYIEGSLIYRHLIVHYALMRPTPVLNENDINFLLNRVEDEVKGITTYLRKVPSDYKHLERWFALMEDNATTNKQRCVLKQLKEHFEQLKQQSTPQTETTSSRAAATQDEGAGKEVQTGTGSVIDFSHMKSFSPVKDLEFDMSAVYKLLIDSSVFEDIDYQLFSNSISHAYINELWGNDTRGRNRNLLQCLFKILAQRYPEQWIKKCATNLGVRVRQITNPTTSGNTKSFEEKLWQVLRTKAPK